MNTCQMLWKEDCKMLTVNMRHDRFRIRDIQRSRRLVAFIL